MKRYTAAVLVLVMCLSSCGLAQLKEDFGEKMDEKIEQHAAEKTTYTQEQLDKEVFEGLSAGKKTIVFDGVVSSDMVQQSVYNARYACPDVFWTEGFSVSTDYSTTTLECESIHDVDEQQLANMYVELNNAVDTIAASIDSGASDYDRLLSLHDKLIEICDYDHDAYAATDQETIGFAGSSYGCLVEHKAVCEGYAHAFSLVARKMGFECGIVCGTSRGENHAWNYVKADGDYYWLDVTWDENATEADGDFLPIHKYFLLDDELFMAGRTVDKDVPFVPQCTMMDNNYYVHNGLYLEGYSFADIDSLMTEHADEGGLDLMFADDESYQTAIDELMENGSIWNTQVMQNGAEAAPYFADPELRTLTITWQ